MASRFLVAALLASGALARALSHVEARDLAFARDAADTPGRLAPEAVKRSPQGEGSGGFDFGQYESQEDFWAEWDTLEAFLTEHASQFESEDDFWQQLEAAFPTEGGTGGAFNFGQYESQEDFWAEWDTLEAFLTEHASQFESEDDFWQQFEAALPATGGSEGPAEGGEVVPVFPGEGEFPGFPGGEEETPEPEEEPEEQPEPIIVVGPIE